MKKKVAVGLLTLAVIAANAFGVYRAYKLGQSNGCVRGAMTILQDIFGPPPSAEVKKNVEDKIRTDLCE